MKQTRLFLLAALLLCAISSWAHDFEVNGIYYNITSAKDKTVAVTYNGYNFLGVKTYSGFVVIPPSVTYDGTAYSVTALESSAFFGNEISKIIIPNSVTFIGDYAFFGCSALTSITIPNSVTYIGESAFNGCTGLTSVTIPNSVTSIGTGAFASCSALTSVTIPNSVTSIGFYVFSGCPELTTISVDKGNTVYDSRDNCNAIIETATNKLIAGCKNTIIPNSVTTIGGYAFYSCDALTTLTIPNSVTSIEFEAFDNCTKLTSLTIGNGVTSIGYKAFCNCSAITSLTLPNSLTSIDDNAFEYCSKLTSINIPDGVTAIGSFAFQYCSSLTSLTIGNSVTSIGEYAFRSCNNLSSVIIGNSVASIGQYAFDGCYNIQSITIPYSVTSIGPGAFRNCILNSVTNLSLKPQLIGAGCFSGYGKLHVYKGYKETYSNAENWKNFTIIDDIELPKPTSFDITAEWIHIDAYKSYDIPEHTIDVPVYKLELSSSDENIVTTDPASNQFVGLQDGMATITVKVVGTDLKDSFKVYVGNMTPGNPVTPPTPKPQCAVPTIDLVNGKVVFGCETKDAVIKHTISSYAYNNSSTDNGIVLSQTYTISAYATADGYTDSETVSKTFTLTPGDMNADGKVDMQDANIIVNQYLGK